MRGARDLPTRKNQEPPDDAAALRDEIARLKGELEERTRQFEKALAENREHLELLTQAKRVAEAADQAKDSFLATVSHELRTPLSAILLWTRLIQDQEKVDPAQLKEALGAISRSADEQRQMIEDLVDTARIGAGKLWLDLRLVEFADVVRAALGAVAPLADDKEIKVAEKIDPSCGTIEADEARLQQVISNLLGNGVKFTPEGGQIQIEARRDRDDAIVLTVRDTGAGIAPEVLPSVFNRFIQAQNSNSSTRTHGGLGIGLSVAKRIVEMHGGTISAASPGPGRGTTFTVRLPLPDKSKPAADAAAGDSKGQLTEHLSGRRILLVEDSESTRAALTAVLEQSGAHVTGTGAALAALEEFKRRPPDLLVSDLGLPNVDGFELIVRIRQWERAQRRTPVPALVLTAFAGDKIAQRALDSGYQKCLIKPVGAVPLVAALAALKPSTSTLNA